MRGKYKGFVLYRQIGQYNENINCMGETAVALPQCGDFGRVLLCRKSVSDIPRGWGPWLQMTGA